MGVNEEKVGIKKELRYKIENMGNEMKERKLKLIECKGW